MGDMKLLYGASQAVFYTVRINEALENNDDIPVQDRYERRCVLNL